MSSTPPRIFDRKRRLAVQRRLESRQRTEGAARFVIDDMIVDLIERIAFVRQQPGEALVIGDWTGALTPELVAQGHEVMWRGIDEIDEELPYPSGGFDLIAGLGTLDTVNDLPGALIHMRNALATGGRVIVQFLGAGSLPNLRTAMLAADGERPAARMHPMVDVRAAAQLLQRAGWSDPVVDSRTLRASYASLDRLISDLRDQGLGSVLASFAPPLTKAGLERAREAFLANAGPNGRVVEDFEILTLSGRRSLAGT
ncbi:methyltransferase domain-containing protein [Altererythrobacter salegens]|uniref:Methyltransferase domain-containing protein n=1 Tax=Croceibacterium salegens TaxID=1737568 RepID=A0A6I4SUL0_9SPHN|nr:methyltransferase domain-containing protein [Croceibacterium salegens]MXO59655.1 methyltransferase domain-containing protein [Croceibacterium salegens]